MDGGRNKGKRTHMIKFKGILRLLTSKPLTDVWGTWGGTVTNKYGKEGNVLDLECQVEVGHADLFHGD